MFTHKYSRTLVTETLKGNKKQFELSIIMVELSCTQKYMQHSTMGKKIWLRIKEILVLDPFHISICEMSHFLARVQGIYYLCLTWYQTSTLWSIDSCQKWYPLTGITWLYWRLRYTTHWGDIFFKVIHWPVISFQLIAGSGPFFKCGIQFAFCL